MDFSFVSNRGTKLIRFQRFQDLIQPGLLTKLTLLCAPAGYGKTSALQIALNPIIHDVVWIELDQQDNSPSHLVEKLIKSLKLSNLNQNHHQNSLGNLFQLIVDKQSSSHSSLTLVFDDYQNIKSKIVHVELFDLILKAPPNIHIFIASRSMPPFPLSKLRLQGDLLEINSDQLSLKPDEIHSFYFLNTGKDLPKEIVQEIWEKSQGWLAVLSIIAVNQKNEKDSFIKVSQIDGTSPGIYSFIEDEIYNQLSPSRREILLLTSILEDFVPGLCETLSARRDALEILRDLSRTHGLLRENYGGYTHIPLIRDFCFQKLLEDRPEQIRLIRQKAANWFEKENQFEEALNQWLEIGDFQNGIRIINQIGWETLQKSGYEIVLQWCNCIEKLIGGLPNELSELKGFALLRKGDIDQAQLVFNNLPAIQGSLASVMIAHYQGQYKAVQKIAQEVLEKLSESEWVLRSQIAIQLGLSHLYLREVDHAEQAFSQALYFAEKASNLSLICVATTMLSVIFYNRGLTTQSLSMLKRSLALSGLNSPDATFNTQIRLAQIELEIGNFQAASDYLETAIAKGEGIVSSEALAYGHIILGRIARLKMDYLSATEHYQTASRLAPKGAFFWESNFTEWMLLHLALDEYSVVKTWIAQRNLSADRAEATSDDCYLVLARYFLRIGDYHAAINTLQKILKNGRENKWGFVDLEVLPWLATAYYLANDVSKANSVFKESILISSRQGYCQAYLEAYQDFPQVVQLLMDQVQQTNMEVEYLKNLSMVFQITPSIETRLNSTSVQKMSITANQFELRLFGGLRVFQGGVELAADGWRTEKARTLLAYFAIHYEHPIPLEKILDDVWPNRPPDESRRLFHTNLYFLKRTLRGENEDLELIRYRSGKYSLNLQYYWIDLMEFDRLISGNPDPVTFNKSLELITGTCLRDIYDDWAIELQNTIDQRILEIHSYLAKYYAGKGETSQAIIHSMKALQIDPLREDMVRLLIGCYGSTGDSASAATVYKTFRQTLKTELGVEPDKDTVLIANRFRIPQ